MTFDALMIHKLAVWRATSGPLDEYGQPTRTYAQLALFSGRIEPLTDRADREVALLSQAGPVISTHRLYCRLRDLSAADQIRTDPDDGRRFEITGIDDAGGAGHHLEVTLRMIGS